MVKVRWYVKGWAIGVCPKRERRDKLFRIDELRKPVHEPKYYLTQVNFVGII